MAYLLDSDIFIAAKNLHYGMDFCPGFWEWLINANVTGKLISIDAVLNDLSPAGDELATWAVARGPAFFVPPSGPDLLALGQVSTWANNEQTYTSAAKQTFLGCSDYFVVSQALAGGHTVVTHEVPAPSTKKIKIPNACIALGVKYMTCWQMLRAERVRLVLK